MGAVISSKSLKKMSARMCASRVVSRDACVSLFRHRLGCLTYNPPPRYIDFWGEGPHSRAELLLIQAAWCGYQGFPEKSLRTYQVAADAFEEEGDIETAEDLRRRA